MQIMQKLLLKSYFVCEYSLMGIAGWLSKQQKKKQKRTDKKKATEVAELDYCCMSFYIKW